MTTRDVLIREINNAPEDVLQQTLRYLRVELRRRRSQGHDQLVRKSS